jgi:hypothetical protein
MNYFYLLTVGVDSYCLHFMALTGTQTCYDTSELEIGPSPRPLLHNTQHFQQKDIHNPGGIRTRITRERAAGRPRFRPRGHCNLRVSILRIYLRKQCNNLLTYSSKSSPVTGLNWPRGWIEV